MTDVPLAQEFHLADRVGAMARKCVFADAILISGKKIEQ